MDKQCHSRKNMYTEADTNLLEALTLQQLEELGKKASFLHKEDRNYVGVEFSKRFAEWLAPGVEFSLEDERAHLLTMYKAAKALPEKFQSLRSSLLVEILKNGIALNEYDFSLFLEYLAHPTAYGMVKRDNCKDAHWDQFLSNVQRASHAPARHADSAGGGGGDEGLIQTQIVHFLNEEFAQEKAGKSGNSSLKKLGDYIEKNYLESIYERTRLKAGLPLEEGGSTRVQEEVQNEVVLKLCEHNPGLFLPEDEVVLDVEVKNIQQLFIKVFEINTENYYRKHMAPFRTDVNLDGLLSTTEELHPFDDPPALSRIRRFPFPELPKRVGLFVIEFIGKGVSSRAVIKKGSLSLIQKPTSMGHQAYILDEHKVVCKGEGVSIFLDGQHYPADDNGRVLIPYARSQHTSPAILRSASGFAQLADFNRLGEAYTLQCESVLLPESLITGAKAQLLLLPHLLCNGRSASLTILKKTSATLSIHTLHASIPTTQTFADLKLENGKELLLEFTVPPLLTRVDLSFSTEVFNLSQKTRQPLSYNHSLTVDLHAGDFLFQELYLSHPKGGYQLHVRGKNGEPKPACPVSLSFTLQIRA